jgi:hypothetical protein
LGDGDKRIITHDGIPIGLVKSSKGGALRYSRIVGYVIGNDPVRYAEILPKRIGKGKHAAVPLRQPVHTRNSTPQRSVDKTVTKIAREKRIVPVIGFDTTKGHVLHVFDDKIEIEDTAPWQGRISFIKAKRAKRR